MHEYLINFLLGVDDSLMFFFFNAPLLKCIFTCSDYGAWNGLPFAFPSQMDNLRDKSKTAMVSHVQVSNPFPLLVHLSWEPCYRT